MKCPNCETECFIDENGVAHCHTCVFSAHPNERQNEQYYMFLSVDEQGREGLIALDIGGMPMPMINVKLETLMMAEERTIKAMKTTGKMRLRLVEFKRSRVVKDYE